MISTGAGVPTRVGEHTSSSYRLDPSRLLTPLDTDRLDLFTLHLLEHMATPSSLHRVVYTELLSPSLPLSAAPRTNLGGATSGARGEPAKAELFFFSGARGGGALGKAGLLVR